MFLISVDFMTSDGKQTLSRQFDCLTHCYKFRDELPNVVFYSISPIKVLSPIEMANKSVVPINVNVTYRSGGRDVINELTIDSVGEWFNELDLKNVSEIRLRVDPFNRILR